MEETTTITTVKQEVRMRDWAERMKNAGAVLLREEGIITNDAPEDDMLEELKAAGQELAQKA